MLLLSTRCKEWWRERESSLSSTWSCFSGEKVERGERPGGDSPFPPLFFEGEKVYRSRCGWSGRFLVWRGVEQFSSTCWARRVCSGDFLQPRPPQSTPAASVKPSVISQPSTTHTNICTYIHTWIQLDMYYCLDIPNYTCEILIAPPHL